MLDARWAAYYPLLLGTLTCSDLHLQQYGCCATPHVGLLWQDVGRICAEVVWQSVRSRPHPLEPAVSAQPASALMLGLANISTMSWGISHWLNKSKTSSAKNEACIGSAQLVGCRLRGDIGRRGHATGLFNVSTTYCNAVCGVAV